MIAVLLLNHFFPQLKSLSQKGISLWPAGAEKVDKMKEVEAKGYGLRGSVFKSLHISFLRSLSAGRKSVSLLIGK